MAKKIDLDRSAWTRAPNRSTAARRRALVQLSLLLLFPGLTCPASVAADPSEILRARVERVLAATPLIDGHNDLPWELRARFKGDLSRIDLNADTAKLPVTGDEVPLMTDIPRLRAGHVGGQFWSVWIPVDMKGSEAVQTTIEQIDLVKAMTLKYPQSLTMAYSSADIRAVHKAGKIASLIGVEGGHQINNSLAVLRAYYDLGARYMTLTHSTNTAWADSATDAPAHHGLTPFGIEVVHEMNRLGMMVDLSHVSAETMRAALAVSEAPVMFSHSSARALVDHPRDVPDDVLQLLPKNGGVVMVNFYPDYISETRQHWSADRGAEVAHLSNPPFGGLYIGQPERARAALAEWEQSHPEPAVGIADVADHIDHIRKVAGVEHVGLGSDFDGVPELPTGLDGVDKYPALLIELARRGWTDDELAKVAGANLLRVMAQVESVSLQLRTRRAPSSATIDQLDLPATAPAK
jgi:membrane dipeptidase